MAIKHVDVESSNIQSLGYDEKNKILEVRFKGGGLYSYKDVPHSTYKALLSSKSIGSAFHALIKNADFEWDKVE